MIRSAERLNLLFFSFLTLLAWLRPLSGRQRLRATLIGLAGIGLTLGCIFSETLLPFDASSTLRDWLPAPLMLMVYWQSGCFFSQANERFQQKLLAADRWLLRPVLGNPGTFLKPRWLASLLELAYLFCYPLVPLGIALLYLSGQVRHADAYWGTVLPATYSCYVLLPFIQTMPPRLLNPNKSHKQSAPGIVRAVNLLILDRASITVNTFPSAHVAATTSAAFALLIISPQAGVAFLVMALAIAAGAVLGRYHYAADALLAMAIAGIVVIVRQLF